METTSTPKDKRVKREIANSNERRRMQSINAGFQKLKRLLPVKDGEKLSKAAILQHAAEFIQQIEDEKLILIQQNTLMREKLLEVKGGLDVTKALENIDLDALPTIPIHIHKETDVNNSNDDCNSNDEHIIVNQNSNSTDNNSSNDCIRSNSTKEVVYRNVNRSVPKTSSTRADHQDTTDEANIISDRVVSPKNSVAKAAIALPLEVPYTIETANQADRHLHLDELSTAPRKMFKPEPTTANPQDPAPKGQNLDTICKAIMEIEGDRVFNDENIKNEATL